MAIEKYHEIEFDWNKHHLLIFQKYKRFIKDFDLEEFIEFKATTEKNPCKECHSLIGEPYMHYKAKKKVFDLFVDNSDYVVFTELHAKEKELQVFDVGLRAYQFDILVVNVKNLHNFFYNFENNYTESAENFIKKIEHDIIFSIELDGDHSAKKDLLRDKFFFETYNIPTIRYQVRDLIEMYSKQRGKVGNRKHMRNFTKENGNALLKDLSLDDILMDCKALYYKRYPILKKTGYHYNRT